MTIIAGAWTLDIPFNEEIQFSEEAKTYAARLFEFDNTIIATHLETYGAQQKYAS